MAQNPRLFRSRLAFSLATKAKKIAQGATKSKRIADAMVLRNLNFGLVSVEVPFYWAVYYHDGRGPVRARPGHKIVFFKNPDEDPRINGSARNYPVRATSIRRLTKAQFNKFFKEGKLISVDSVRSADGDPFFTKGLQNFRNRTGPVTLPKMSEFVKQCLGPDLRKKIRTVVVF